MNEPLKILIADDDVVDRLAARRALSQIGREVMAEEASSCRTTTQAILTQTFDCVLLDYQFPDGNGLEIVQEVRAAGIDTPIIMLTGHGDELVAVELIKAGASDYLSKTKLSPDRLAQSVRSVLRTHDAEQYARDMDTALHESEARYRTLIEQSPLSIQIFSPDGVCTEANQAWEELWATSRDHAIGYRILEDPQVESSGILAALERAFSGKVITIPATYYDPAASSHPGRPRWIQMTLYPVRDKEGAIREIALLHQDVTDQRLVEQRLRASESRFRWIYDSNVIGIFFWEASGRITDANDAFLAMVGYTRDDLTIGNLDWKAITPEEYREQDVRLLQELDAKRICQPFEKEYLCRDGSRVAVLAGASYLDGPGRNGLSFVIDITERRKVQRALEESEQRYRFMSETIPQIVWTAEPDGRIDYYNSRWYEYTGATLEETRDWRWHIVLHPDDVQSTIDRWKQSLETGEVFEIEIRFQRASDQTYRWHLCRALPLRDPDGLIIKWFGSCTDIDDQKRTAEAQRFLAEASTVLGSSLDYRTTLRNVAQLAVPQIADWCTVDLLNDDDAIRRVATSHTDPEKVELARTYEKRYPIDLTASSGLPEVLRTGNSEMVSDITDDQIIAAAQDEEHLTLLRDLGMRSYICVALKARDRTLGAVTLVSSEIGRRYDNDDLVLAEELARRAALAVDNARLFFEAKARADREALVNAIGKKLRSSLDSNEILRVATREVGQALNVSRCLWAWLTPRGDVFEIWDEQYKAPGMTPMTGKFAVASLPSENMAQLSSGQPVIVNNSDLDGALQRYLTSLGRSLEYRAFINMPIFVRGALAGVLVVQQVDQAREWNEDEIALMTAVADILGLALENAGLYAREHRVADMLQTAFLSNIPETLADLDLAAKYRAGLEESHVGGDYYDAFLLPDGRVALVMADVSGKGLSAAVQTATVKYSLRAFAAEAAAPGLVLTRLNRALRSDAGSLGEHFVTLFYAVYDPGSGRLTYASAGHETLAIKRALGGSTLLISNNPILGIAEHRFEQSTDRLDPGDTLAMYTDGLTEARNPQTRELLDVDRVVAALEADTLTAGPDVLLDHLEKLALDWSANRPHDDMALLFVRRMGGSSPTSASALRASYSDSKNVLSFADDSNKDEPLFEFEFPSIPDYAGEVRQALAHWMPMLGFERNAIEDFQTAVTEAVTNAVRHGSPNGSQDHIRVFGYRTSLQALSVEVEDNGFGMAQNKINSPMPAPEAMGGRGLPLMQQLADNVEYVSENNRHRVRLTIGLNSSSKTTQQNSL